MRDASAGVVLVFAGWSLAALTLPGAAVGQEGSVGEEPREIEGDRPSVSEMAGEEVERSIDMGLERMDEVEGDSAVERAGDVVEADGTPEWVETDETPGWVETEGALFGTLTDEAVESESVEEEMEEGMRFVKDVVGACPRDLLRKLLVSAVGQQDTLAALAVEREVLKLCHERQLLVTGLLETEAKLRELVALPVEDEEVVVEDVVSQLLSVKVPEKVVVEVVAAEKKKEAPPPPRYTWFSVMGSLGVLRAGVSDGSKVWFVGEGARLPGGVRVLAITARPPGVRVSGAADELLSYGPYPSGAIVVSEGGAP